MSTPTKTSTDDKTTNPLQSAISDINTEFKEREVQIKARDLGIPYIDVSIVPINEDLLRIISEEESKELEMIVFFQVGKKLRIAVVNNELPAFQKKVRFLEDQGYILNINICSKEKLTIAQASYKRIKKHNIEAETLEKEAIISANTIAEEIKSISEIPERFAEIPSDLALAILNRKAIALNASDIHFESTPKGVRVRGRIDGVLQDFFILSYSIAKGIVRQIKFNAKILANVSNTPQDGQFSFFIETREIMVRVSVLPNNKGESIVLRYLDPKKQEKGMSSLGFLPDHLEKIQNLLEEKEGFIVVTGPTGSGKTTTLYSMIKAINTAEKKIITLEDPVEYTLEGVVQSSIDEERGFSFSSGLKSCLRQDPDILLIGEIRDFNTAETALQASLTGHLVLSTLHTNSALDTLTRLRDLNVPSYMVGNALKGVIAQRLLRKVCTHCSKEVSMTDSEQKNIIRILRPFLNSGKNIPKSSGKIKTGKGCKHCGHSGYKGRTIINEVLTISPKLSTMIREEKKMSNITKYLEEEHQTFFSYDAALKILEGTTDYKEVIRVLGNSFIK